MNIKMIKYFIGLVLRIEGMLLLLPFIVGIIYQEDNAKIYLFAAIFAFILGSIISFKKPKNTIFYLKEGCITTALSWIILSAVGSIPFILSCEINNFTDAFFETVSGFTTTGASILTDVESLSHSSLFWRSFTHWIGGMGVLVFLLAIIPLSGGSHINLMKAESPGPSVGKFTPKTKSSASILYKIYLFMTILQVALLLIYKMPLFDALCLTFGTAGTGGFGVKNTSIADYTSMQQWIIAIFMMLFGINFNFYYFVINKKIKKAFAMEEVRWYIFIILSATFGIFLQLNNFFGTLEGKLRQSFFQVSSIITTTGYSTTDFNKWTPNCHFILILLMLIGSCAGSTGGGFKVSRLIIIVKSLITEIKSYLHPKSINKINMDGSAIPSNIVKSTLVYLVTYVIIFIISHFIITLEGKDFLTSFTAVSATFNNIGPGLGSVGPASNFSMLSNISKWVLSFDMLAGRLELFPLILLFTPSVYKRPKIK